MVSPFFKNLSPGLVGGAPDFYPYKIRQGCRFNDNDSPYLSRTQGVPTDNRIWTFSTWVKRCNLTGSSVILLSSSNGTSSNRDEFYFTNADVIQYAHIDGGAVDGRYTTLGVFRDTSSWYNIIIRYDSTQATSADRVTIFINGSEASATEDDILPLNKSSKINSNTLSLSIGRRDYNNDLFLDGHLADTIFVDGQALSPTSFGTTKNNIWIPIDYKGTYGDNGFRLDFSDSADFGNDISGNNNDFTDSGLAANDQVEDTPTNNWCVMNNLEESPGVAITSNGNLDVDTGTGNNWGGLLGTFAIPSSGKWYWETILTSGIGHQTGIGTKDLSLTGDTSASANASTANDSIDDVYIEGVIKNAYFASGAPGSVVIGVCVNMDDGEISWQTAADGQGTAYSITTTKEWFPMQVGFDDDWRVNFGQIGGFTLTPPIGFKALNSSNLLDPSCSIFPPSKGFDVAIWTGDGSGDSISGLDFQPDLVWQKLRDTTTQSYKLVDDIRGAGEEIFSDRTNAETTNATGLTSFDSGGFTYGTGGGWHENSRDFVAWLFREGASYGFDIVSYVGNATNRTIAHSLGIAPEMIIIKNRTSVSSWIVGHDRLDYTNDEYLTLDTTDPTAVGSGNIWNNTAPTSSVFSVGTNNAVNQNTNNLIAYLFSSIEGFSKVFDYTGNASADGPFVYCGFRPRFIWIKNASNANNWFILDTERSEYNVSRAILYPNLSNQEAYSDVFDFLSNGFKIRNTGAAYNGSGQAIIGIAFAEHPFKYANAG